MSPAGLQHYVVTLHYQEENLSDIQELTSAMVSSGFSTTLHGDDGKIHELGIHSFGIVTSKKAEEIQQEVTAAADGLSGQQVSVDVQPLEVFLQHTP